LGFFGGKYFGGKYFGVKYFGGKYFGVKYFGGKYFGAKHFGGNFLINLLDCICWKYFLKTYISLLYFLEKNYETFWQFVIFVKSATNTDLKIIFIGQNRKTFQM